MLFGSSIVIMIHNYHDGVAIVCASLKIGLYIEKCYASRPNTIVWSDGWFLSIVQY